MTTTTVKASIVTLVAVAAFAIAPLANAAPGNNGTLKVHEKGTPSRTESNDPKVCVFNFEGYGFDEGQAGVIVISSQMNGKDKVGIKQVDMPAANAEGYTETEYVTVPNGHYKTTLFGKDVHGTPDYNKELKAKSKVIKVQCDGEGGQVSDDAVSTTKPGSTKPGKTLGTTSTEIPAELPATGINVLSLVSTLGVAVAGYGAALRIRK